LFRWAARLTDAIVCVSKDSAQRSLLDGLQKHKICTILNGTDVSRFEYAGPAAGGPAVMVGRLSPEKDVATLLKAAAIAQSRAPGFRLEIAGDGVCSDDLKAQATALGLDGAVRFLGNVQDIPRLLAGASMCVLSSITEGISLTLLEAMSCGLPVVATRVGGNTEIIQDGQTGLLVPAQDPSLLAEAMLQIWHNPQMGKTMGSRGRDRVQSQFDVRQMVQRYQDLYLGRSPADIESGSDQTEGFGS